MSEAGQHPQPPAPAGRIHPPPERRLLGTGIQHDSVWCRPTGGADLHRAEWRAADRGALSFYDWAGGTGDFLLQINTVDPTTGLPTDNTLDSAPMPRSAVPNVPALVLFSFPLPPALVAGRQYALVLSQPTGTGFFGIDFANPGTCPGGGLFSSPTATAPFTPLQSSASDITAYATYVSP